MFRIVMFLATSFFLALSLSLAGSDSHTLGRVNELKPRYQTKAPVVVPVFEALKVHLGDVVVLEHFVADYGASRARDGGDGTTQQ